MDTESWNGGRQIRRARRFFDVRPPKVEAGEVYPSSGAEQLKSEDGRHLPESVRPSDERLVEYGWKPRRMFVAQTNYYLQASTYRHRRPTIRGVRFHRTRDVKQHYFNSIPTQMLDDFEHELDEQ